MQYLLTEEEYAEYKKKVLDTKEEERKEQDLELDIQKFIYLAKIHINKDPVRFNSATYYIEIEEVDVPENLQSLIRLKLAR